jgi:hypothetical protein
VGLFGSTLFAKEQFDYVLTPLKIQPGNHAVLQISVPIEKEDNESSISINDSLLFQVNDISILEKTSQRTACCLEIKYELTGYKNNSYVLPPIEIKAHGNSFSTESKTLTVESGRPPEDNDLRESFSSLSPPWPLKKWGFRILICLILVAAAYVILKKWKSRPPKRKNVTKPTQLIPQEEPLVWLKGQLAQLQQKLIEDPNNEFLVDIWSQIIRGYVFRLNSLPALASTTRELKKLCSDNPKLLKLIPCLESSDRYRFETETKEQRRIKDLLDHFIKETENHLILCGN